MTKLYKEEQRYHDYFSIGLLATIGSLMIYKIVESYFILQTGIPFAGLTILGVSLFLAFYLYKNLKLKIKISPKNLIVKIAPLFWTHLKINKKEIEQIQFFEVTEAQLSSGWAMNFGHRSSIFNFGDKQGLIITKTNGEQVVVFSKKLYAQRVEVQTLLADHNWKVSVIAD